MRHKAGLAVVIIFALLATFSVVKSDEISFIWEKNNNEIEFEALSDGNNYTWYFGDGSTGYGKIVSHTYASDGTYNVILTVDGDSSNMSINTLNDPPSPDFYWIPSTPYSYQYVQFFDASNDSDGWIINWSWDFENDGIIDAYGKYAIHQFTKPGPHDVALRVIDNEGRMAGITKQIFVLNILPVPSFKWTKYNGSILFNASESYDSDGYIVNYTWYFGDGSTGYGKIVSHVYAKSGKYIVKLYVRDDFGETNYTQAIVDTSNKIPRVDFYWEPTNPTDLDTVHFYSTSNDSDGYIVNYTWYFGDGSIAYGKNVSHNYTVNGIYNVTLLVVDNEMAYNCTTKEIVIRNIPPVANFSYSPVLPIPHRTIYFNSSSYDSDGYIVNYTWYFGDGSIAYGKNVSHNYTEHGFYNLTLVVIDDDGASSSKKIKLVIADYYVNKSIYDPVNYIWKKVQDAVDNATAQSFIYVMDGKYTENVYVDKSVYLLGRNAEISGGQYSFYFDADEIVIENFTIRNAENGVIIESNNTLIRYCNFDKNDVSINVSGNYNVMEYNDIKGEKCLDVYGNGNIVRNNTVYGDVGIAIHGGMNNIWRNKIGGGVGIEVAAAGNSIEENMIYGCDYGIKMLVTGNIVNNIIENNTCAIFGSGTIGKNIIRNNTCGINSTSMTVVGTIFYGNKINMEGNNFIVKNTSINGGDISVDTLTIYNTSIEYVKNIFAENMFVNLGNIKGCDFIHGEIHAINSHFDNNNKIDMNGLLLNCGFTGNGEIIINDSSIHNCSFENNDYALFLKNENEISNCTFNSNNYAIFINGSGNNIENNTFYRNGYAIMMYHAQDNNVFNNSMDENENAIVISFSRGNRFHGNIMNNNTYNIDINGNEVWYFYNVINGSIDGKPVIYLVNRSDILLNKSYGFVGIIGCNNINVSNQYIHNNGKSIVIVGSHNINIVGGEIRKSINAIYALKSNNISIKECNVNNNSFGISFVSSYDNFVKCNIENNGIGLKLFDIQKKDGRNRIYSRFHGNQIGIYIYMMESNYIDGNVDSVKIDGSNGNIFNGSIHKIDLRDCTIKLTNATIDEITAYSSSIDTYESIIYNLSADKTEMKMEKSKFLGEAEINDGNFMVYNSIFNGSICNILNSTISMQSNEFYNSTLKINMDNGNISNSVFHGNKIALEINASVTIINCSFYNNTGAIYAVHGTIYGGSIFNNTYGCVINGSAVVHGVLFHHNSYALILDSDNSTVYECSFWKNFYGIVANGNNNSIYHNNFVYNIKDAVENAANKWNLSYPEGGNYWDEYAGIDEKHGAGQNESGGDGIGDMPYAVGNSFDYYPLMSFYENAAAIPNSPPVASFRFYPSNPYSFEKIVFIDLSDDANGKMDIVSWHWDFGDGTASNEENPMHVYEKPGNYTVKLIVKDRAGSSNESIAIINVTNIPPHADYSYSPSNISSYTVVYFISKSNDIDGHIVNYTWNFGDGSIGYGTNASHTYEKPGEYEVTLTVKDDLNGTASITKKIVVNNRKPSADFEFYPEQPKEGEKIAFKDLSTDVDGDIVSWHWDFGDGTASNERNATHVYTKAGTYIVKLTVKDDNGDYSTYEKTVEVKAKSTPGMGIVVLILAVIIMAVRRKFK